MRRILIDDWEDEPKTPPEVFEEYNKFLIEKVKTNDYIRVFLTLFNFLKDNSNIVNKISVINNRYDRFMSFIKRDIIIDSNILKKFFNERISDDVYYYEGEILQFIDFLEFMTIFGFKNDSDGSCWFEKATNGIELYMKIYNDRILHFSEYDHEVTPLLIRSENSLLSVLQQDDEEETIHTINYEETDDTLDKPIIALKYRKIGNTITNLVDETFLNEKASLAFMNKFVLNIRKLYKSLLLDNVRYIGIENDSIVEEIINGKRICIAKSVWEQRNSN